ncbi:uncharacterized protein L201_006621 [Kwoniella dendrophila CBS 6074]|uniref:Protein AF-9 homolog n=1 Tax=Kwoniella dendrophila CBS 6074 TaxID=1295534 RepID=A0AAX4K232_9TREE
MSASERIKGIQVHRPIIYGSHARLLTEEEKLTAPAGHTHRWTVFLTSAATPPPRRSESGEIIKDDIDWLPGGADDLSYLIKKVTFKLHDTYPSPNRAFDKPPFAVTETGWGEFVVQIRIQFIPESSEKPLTLNHPIKLHHWGAPIENFTIPIGNGQPEPITNTESTTAVNTPASTNVPPQSVAPAKTPNDDQQPVSTTENNGNNVTQTQTQTQVKEEISTPAVMAEDQVMTKDEIQVNNSQGDQPMVTENAQKPETNTNNDDQNDTSHSEIIVDTTGTAQQQIQQEEQLQHEQNLQPISIASILPVHSWQYDEIIFSDPSKAFLDILNENPPIPLPYKNRRSNNQREEYDSSALNNNNNKKSKKQKGRQSTINSRANTSTEFSGTPSSTPAPTTPSVVVQQQQPVIGIPGELASADIPLEFSLEMEKSEYNKLNEARKKIVEQMDKWRERLITQEKELNKLKEEVKSM